MAQPDDLADVMKDVMSKLGQLPGAIGELGRIIQRFTSAFSPLLNAIGGVMATRAATGAIATTGQSATVLPASIDRLNASVTRLTILIERLVFAAMSRVYGHSGLALTGGGGGGGSGGGPPSFPGGTGGGGGGIAGGIAGVAKVATIAAVALGALVVSINIVQEAFQKLAGFVRLFNPGVMMIFQYALDNLGATIGRAFVPMFQNMTQVIQRYTAMLAPVMQQLAPLVKQFADIFANTLLRVLTLYTSVMQAMMPLLQQMNARFSMIGELVVMLANAFTMNLRALAMFLRIIYEFTPLGLIVKALTKAMEVFNKVMEIGSEAMTILEVVLGGLIDSFMTFVGSFFPVTNIMEKLGEAVQFVIRNMYVLAVMMAKLVGLTDIADALIRSVEGKLGTGDVAAQQVQMKSLDQLTKDIAIAAATAMGAAGGGGVRNQQEFWTKTLEEMKAARNGQMSLRDIVNEILKILQKGMFNVLGGPTSSDTPGGGAVGGGGLPATAGGIARGAGIGAAAGPGGMIVGGIVGGIRGRFGI